METIPINNAFLGFVGGVNTGASAEPPSTEESNSLDFFAVLKSIIASGCLKGEGADAESTATSQQFCGPGCLCPALPALFQKALIENVTNGENEEGDFKKGLLGLLSEEHAAEEGDTGTLEINLAGANAAAISDLIKIVTVLCDALSKPGLVNMSVEQVVDKGQDEGGAVGLGEQSTSDRPFGSDEKRGAINDAILPLLTFISEALSQAGMKVEQTTGKGDGEATIARVDRERLIGKVEGNDEKELSSRPELQGLIESVLAPQIANGSYTSTEQFVAKKEEKDEGLHVPSAPEKTSQKHIVLTIGSSDGKSGSISRGTGQKEFGDQADDKMQVLFRSLTDTAARKDIKNDDAALSNRLLVGTDGEEGSGNRNAARILLNAGEKVLTETVVKLKEDTEPQAKDVKVSSQENGYIPFSKNGNPESSSLQEAQNHKVLKEAGFASVMTERIEKIVEQFSAKGNNMDMILRLKIDDRETLLVGLKNEGQKVMVDVKSTNEGVMNILQTQKDVISRNLEEKHVYTNIYLDPDGSGSFERRESRQEERRKEQDSSKTNFIEFLEASA